MKPARCEHGVRWFRHCAECITGDGLLGVNFIEVREFRVCCPTCGEKPSRLTDFAWPPNAPWGPRCKHGAWPESGTGCIVCGITTAIGHMRAREDVL